MNKVTKKFILILLLPSFLFLQCKDDKSSTKITKKQWKTILAWQWVANTFALTNNLCTDAPAQHSSPSTSLVYLSSGQKITDNRNLIYFIIPITQRGTPSVDVTLNDSNCDLFVSTIRCFGGSSREDLDYIQPPPKQNTYTITKYTENRFGLVIETRQANHAGTIVNCSYTIHAY